MREVADFEQPGPAIRSSCLALLDARPVAGDARVFERFGTAASRRPDARDILESLLALIDERHAEFNDTLYQLEPDVKESPGRAARPRRDAHDRAC